MTQSEICRAANLNLRRGYPLAMKPGAPTPDKRHQPVNERDDDSERCGPLKPVDRWVMETGLGSDAQVESTFEVEASDDPIIN